jgi:uncharacterized protein YrrD
LIDRLIYGIVDKGDRFDRGTAGCGESRPLEEGDAVKRGCQVDNQYREHQNAKQERAMRKPYRLKELTGYVVNASDGEIGKLDQVYFDDRRWVVRYFIVRTGGWLTGRKVLILPGMICGMDEESRTLDVDLTREHVEKCPPADTELPVSRHYEQEYYRYYGWEPYWSGDPFYGPGPYIPLPTDEGVPEEPEEPHLRSSDEVNGYAIHARDGNIGHVEDFILEEPEWSIRYLVVDTRNWLPGKHVLIAPAWIEKVDWSKQEVAVKLKRETIETAPPYDPDKIIGRDYQVALYGHYGMKYREDES